MDDGDPQQYLLRHRAELLFTFAQRPLGFALLGYIAQDTQHVFPSLNANHYSFVVNADSCAIWTQNIYCVPGPESLVKNLLKQRLRLVLQL